MPPRLALLNADEATAVGLRLLKCFLALRDRRNREELIALAERLLKEEEKKADEPCRLTPASPRPNSTRPVRPIIDRAPSQK